MIGRMKDMLRSVFRGREMMQCEEALEALFEYLDGELDPADSARVEEHLEICKRCYPRAEFERSFLEALERARGGEKASEDLQARVLAALDSGHA